MTHTQRVNIRKLKNFAFSKLPKEWVLRDLLLCEKDELGVNEFLAKIDVWLKLVCRIAHERSDQKLILYAKEGIENGG